MTTLNGFHHVKLPVSDVARSRDWYSAVMGLHVDLEFVEDGVLMGVAMRDSGGGTCLAARHDPARAAALAGFDPVTFGVPTLADLQDWQRRLDELQEAHGGIVAGHQGWALVGLHDPDGIEVRLYTLPTSDGRAPR
jgi:catechol 2,3-dioxygenase-like lactoylglutathione lyase family enzyme